MLRGGNQAEPTFNSPYFNILEGGPSIGAGVDGPTLILYNLLGPQVNQCVIGTAQANKK